MNAWIVWVINDIIIHINLKTCVYYAKDPLASVLRMCGKNTWEVHSLILSKMAINCNCALCVLNAFKYWS